jgi:hypothetical protein
MGEQVTAGPWEHRSGEHVRMDAHGFWIALVSPTGWSVVLNGRLHGRDETGQAGRDAADAALRAAGVVLL